MALLGTFWDVQRNRTIAGGNAPLTTTFVHSLGVAPHLVLPVLRSLERMSHTGALFAEGGNASLATLGVQLPSIATSSAPVTDFDLYVVTVHSIIQ